MWFKLSLVSLLPLALALTPPGPGVDFTNVTVFAPPASWSSKRTSYGRTVVLKHDCSNTILSTFTASPPGEPYFPVFQSNDGGKSWSELSRIFFTTKNYTGGALFQPFLYELPRQFGKYTAGTILATGNGIGSGFASTNIELHASEDKGKTWEFVSLVATGGAPNTTNGADPIWEPFLLAHGDELGVFYSDQRDPKHGQKLAHQTSKDLLNWGPVVNDVALANYTLRPGMTTIAELGNGKFMISFELGMAPGDVDYAVHYRIANSPFEFDSSPIFPLVATDGTVPAAGPYTIWTPAGGKEGTIAVSDSTYPEVFVNTKSGDPSVWQKMSVAKDQGVSYTRSLTLLPGTKGKELLFLNGGYYGLNAATVTAGEWIVPGLEAEEQPCIPGN